jgi:energy-coupling factor transport system ATP-binding protein
LAAGCWLGRWHAPGCWPPSRRASSSPRSDATASLIEARNWGWRHGGRRAWALRGLDLRIEAGERVLLLGPSGAGKSTLLAALAGLLDERTAGQAEGELKVGGLDPRSVRERTGIVFQDPESQLVMARAGDEVAFGLENRCVPTPEIWPRVDRALAQVGFGYGRDRPTDALSGGEQQRLALAGTFALGPRLLLLDEPTANLDPVGAALVRQSLEEILADPSLTLIVVEHRLAAALPLVRRAVVLEAGGGVVADGPPDEIFSRLGDQLAAAGVWVPDRPLARPARRGQAALQPMVLAEGVTYTYPGEADAAVDGVDLHLNSGEVLAIIGANGSGKSTLALLLGGLVTPGLGRVMAGSGLPGAPTRPLAKWRARQLAAHVGSVFQDPEHQFLSERVGDELRLGPMRAGLSAAAVQERVDDLLARLHLAHLVDANPFTLSGGEKRRLSVGTALAAGPSVLLLDEPTFGQDRRTAVELLQLLAGLADAGSAVAIVTHDQPFAAALADRTVRLEHGRLG